MWLELSGSETVSRTGEHTALCSASAWVMPWEGGRTFHCSALLGTSPSSLGSHENVVAEDG